MKCSMWEYLLNMIKSISKISSNSEIAFCSLILVLNMEIIAFWVWDFSSIFRIAIACAVLSFLMPSPPHSPSSLSVSYYALSLCFPLSSSPPSSPISFYIVSLCSILFSNWSLIPSLKSESHLFFIILGRGRGVDHCDLLAGMLRS